MIEYTIKVQHDEDEISVTILDLDPETYEKDRDAIIGALKRAIFVVEKNHNAMRFQ
jgi:predicted KAP-like P-loop ATPase